MGNDPGKGEFTQVQRSEILQAVCRLLKDKYVFPDVATRSAAEILGCMERGTYDLPCAEFAEALTRDLQRVSGDPHLRVVHDPERVSKLRGTGTQGGGPDPSELAKFRNHGFARVERLKGNIGYIDIRHFFPPALSGETAAAAMRFVADSAAVIVDLRSNTGGNPSMVQFLCSYFVGAEAPVHLNSITSRPQRTTTEYWTLPKVPGKRMPDTDLTVLTSTHTFSGGEEFAYNMASLERGALIGETTAGGANPAGIDVISNDFYVTIPHATPTNPITHSNWEGCGVTPHIKVPADNALEVAHTRILTRLMNAKSDELARTKLQWLLEEVVSSYHPTHIPAPDLEGYVGNYGDTEVKLEQDTLIYQRRFFRYKLVPLSETLFWLDGPSAGFESRVEFIKDESGIISQLVGRFPDGRTITHQRG